MLDDQATLFERKKNELIFPYLFDSKEKKGETQSNVTKKCFDLSKEMTTLIFQSGKEDYYQSYLQIITNILSIDFDMINIPFNTFNSHSIPRILTMLIKNFPNTELCNKSIQLSEILSRGSCAKQYCDNDFIPLALQYLNDSINLNNNNYEIINELLIILSNLFHYCDDGMVHYKDHIFETLTRFFQVYSNDIILENVFHVFSNMFQYPQYFTEEFIITILPFFMNYISDSRNQNNSSSFSFALLNIHQIIEINPNLSKLVINPESLKLFIQLTLCNVNNINIASILILISSLKRNSPNEIKSSIILKCSWDWFLKCWNLDNNSHDSLSELFYYLIYNDKSLIISAIGFDVCNTMLNSMKDMTYISRMILSQNLIRILLSNVPPLFIYLLENNFIETLNEFLENNEIDMLSSIFSFYIYFLQLVRNGTISPDKSKIYDFHNIKTLITQLNIGESYLNKRRDFILKELDDLFPEL